MHKLFYQPSGCWFGDCMPFYHDGQFYLFHQRDTRVPDCFGEPFGWSLVTTADFAHFSDRGEPLRPGGDGEQDQFLFAGSLFSAGGRFYALYTGYNRGFAQQGKPSQVLMLATSPDLLTWEKTTEKLVSPQPGYDPHEWRDPYVFWNADSGEYVMILGARKLEGAKQRTGCTVWFTSTDLKSWKFQGDFWAPNQFYMHEMPDLFKIGEYWYLLTTEYSDRCKTIYRISKSLRGPWLAPADDAFDGRAYYAARSCSDGERRYLFGWVPTRHNEDDLAHWDWGGTLVVHEVYQRPDGSLGVRAPDGVQNAFARSQILAAGPLVVKSQDGTAAVSLARAAGDVFRFDADVEISAGTRAFGIRLFEDKTSGDTCEFTFHAAENRVIFGRSPNHPWHRYQNLGMERPLHIQANRKIHLQLIVDDNIAVLYVDGAALSARMYARPGQALSIFVVSGSLTLTDAVLATGLR